MIAPMPGPKKPQLACCGAQYKTGQPIAHRPGCGQGGRGGAQTMVLPVPKVKQADPGLAAELALAERLNAAGLVGWERQFHWSLSERTPTGKPRLYHSDFARPNAMVLCEVEGQAHSIRERREADCHRASLAAALGWRMVRVTKDMIVDDGPHGAISLVRRALAWGGA